MSSIRPGDLVIYSFASHADHVAIYAGNNKTIDTATHHSPAGSVGYSALHRAGGTIAGVVRPYGSTAAPKSAPVQASGWTYTVRRGDWLSKIAPRYHTTWPKLYAANKSVIGSDPDYILPGQVLRLPDSGQAT